MAAFSAVVAALATATSPWQEAAWAQWQDPFPDPGPGDMEQDQIGALNQHVGPGTGGIRLVGVASVGLEDSSFGVRTAGPRSRGGGGGELRRWARGGVGSGARLISFDSLYQDATNGAIGRYERSNGHRDSNGAIGR